jgi:hypothetical protein
MFPLHAPYLFSKCTSSYNEFVVMDNKTTSSSFFGYRRKGVQEGVPLIPGSHLYRLISSIPYVDPVV